jgi:shikimate kinase
MRKIILSGYMGSGKSTVASLLHQRNRLPLFDLDTIIETRANRSITDIFQSKGEIFFRKLEHETLKEILAAQNAFILSLGGGTPCYANNHELLKAAGLDWIYLKASPQTLIGRLSSGSENRPLLAGKTAEELESFIAQHLFERSFFYNQAKYKITTDGKSPDAIVAEIEKILA